MSQQTINTPRDTTLQATNTALGLLAKDATLLATNTALGDLAQDDTLEDVVTNLSTIITKLQAIATALTPSIANDYDELVDKPQINGVTLSGNKTSKQLGIRQTIPMDSAAYALLSSAEKMDPDKDYIITDANAVNVPVDDNDISVNKVWSSKKTDDTKADKEAILQTVEECDASTDPDDIAGAAAVSALNSNMLKLQLKKTSEVTANIQNLTFAQKGNAYTAQTSASNYFGANYQKIVAVKVTAYAGSPIQVIFDGQYIVFIAWTANPSGPIKLVGYYNEVEISS
jgi:hypothetical protein